MSHRTVDEVPIPEKATPPLTMVLKDEAGAVVPGSQLSTCTLNLFNRGTEDVVNDRTNVSIQGVNGGAIDEQGKLTWQPAEADMAILDQTSRQEWRVARVDYTWASGAKRWRHELVFCVQNLARLS